MSDSGYKIKGHQRLRSVKPYERPKNLVGKVKQWLSPSSWASYFTNRTDSDGADTNQQADQAPTPNQFLQLPPLVRPNIQSDDVTISEENSTNVSKLNSDKNASNIQRPKAHQASSPAYSAMGTSVLSAESDQVGNFLKMTTSHIESSHLEVTTNSCSNSDASWVAEDDGKDHDQSKPKSDPVTKKHSKRPIRISLVEESSFVEEDEPSPCYTYKLGEGKASIVQSSTYLVTPGAEVTVQSIINPAYDNKLPKLTSPKTTNGTEYTTTTGTTSAARILTHNRLNHRLHNGTRSINTSTPLLHEDSRIVASFSATQPPERMQPFTDDTLTYPSSKATTPSSKRSQIQAHVGRPSFNVTPFLMPSRVDTNESIKRSPFHSPFYSGRTVYGGAANTKLQLKRPHPDSNSPSYVSQKAATVCPSISRHDTPPLISETAKRILSSLQTSNSPLSDARRIPMRPMPGDEQPPKRRRVVSPSTTSVVSTPPHMTPLHEPLRITRPQHHPSNGMASVSPEIEIVSVEKETPSIPKTLSSSGGKDPGFSLINPISSKTSTILSNLKFTPAPVTKEIGEEKVEKGKRDRSPSSGKGLSESESSGSTKVTGKSSGKIRATKHSYQHFSRRSEEEIDTFVNPLALPPAVGLSIGTGKTLSDIKFHTQLTTKVSGKSIPPESSILSCPGSVSKPSSQDFSFSSPIAVTAQKSQAEEPKQVSDYDFTVPRSHTLSLDITPSLTITHTSSPFTSSLGSSSFPSSVAKRITIQSKAPFLPTIPQTSFAKPSHSGPSLIKPRPKENTPLPILPLKSASVEEVFKGIQPPVKLSEVDKPTDKSFPRDTIMSGTKEPNQLKPLSQFTPVAGSWSCDTCYVSNKPESLKCVACQSAKSSLSASNIELSKPSNDATLKARFSAPSDSWECGTCMITNSANTEKCAACSAPKTKPPPSLAAQFAPPPDSWECDSCMVKNKGSDGKCVACTAARPERKAAPQNSGKKLRGNAFGLPQKPAGSWVCNTCLVENKNKQSSCVSCSAPRPGQKSGIQLMVAQGANVGSASGVSLGFKLGGVSLAGSSSGVSKLGGGVSLGGSSLGSSGGLKLGSGISLAGSTSGGLKLGGISLAGSSLGTSEGLKLGGGESLADSSLGNSGGFKLGAGVSLGGETSDNASGALDSGESKEVKINTGVPLTGLQPQVITTTVLGGNASNEFKTSVSSFSGPEAVHGDTSGSGVAVSSTGGLTTSCLSRSGLGMGSSGGLKLGTSSSSGLDLGVSGGFKFGSTLSSSGLGLGTSGGFKFGSSSSASGLGLGTEVKLGSESVSIVDQSKVLGSELHPSEKSKGIIVSATQSPIIELKDTTGQIHTSTSPAVSSGSILKPELSFTSDIQKTVEASGGIKFGGFQSSGNEKAITLNTTSVSQISAKLGGLQDSVFTSAGQMITDNLNTTSVSSGGGGMGFGKLPGDVSVQLGGTVATEQLSSSKKVSDGKGSTSATSSVGFGGGQLFKLGGATFSVGSQLVTTSAVSLSFSPAVTTSTKPITSLAPSLGVGMGHFGGTSSNMSQKDQSAFTLSFGKTSTLSSIPFQFKGSENSSLNTSSTVPSVNPPFQNLTFSALKPPASSALNFGASTFGASGMVGGLSVPSFGGVSKGGSGAIVGGVSGLSAPSFGGVSKGSGENVSLGANNTTSLPIFQFQAGSALPGTTSSGQSSSSFNFSGNSRGQVLSVHNTGSMETSNQPPPTFSFGQNLTSKASADNTRQGYQFDVGTGINMNFAQSGTLPNLGSGSTDKNRRVIKRAARRKKI